MKSLRLTPCSLLVVLLASFTGCASRPDEALKLAQQALDQAKRLEAADFAPADWNSAQKAWDSAQKALESQKYSEAAALLTTARSRFEKAATIAKAQREDFRTQLSVMQTAVNKRLAGLREELGASRTNAKGKQAFNDALVEIEASAEKVNTEMLNEQLIQAKASAKSALEKLDQLALKIGKAGGKQTR